MRHFIIELTKLDATPKAFLSDMFTIWMSFIKNPATIPPEFLEIPEIKAAMDELTYMSSDPETRAVYDARLKELNDIYAGQTVKYKEGLEAGRAEERAKSHSGKIETAKKMLSKGLDISDICEFTGLSVKEIQSL